MNLALPRLEPYGLNRRVLTLEDAERVCKDQKVKLFYDGMLLYPGLYMVRKKRPGIFLNARLTPAMQAVVLWHEIAHHLLHAPLTCFYNPVSQTGPEIEAQAIAVIAVMPLPLLMSKTFAEVQEEYGYPDELMWFRKEIYEQYRI